jgi:cyclic beta-1,2-glucan synthetase
MILLLTPPFDTSPRDPGYIKGYLPGVRENGAQYTHAALWTVFAAAGTGDGDRAFQLLDLLNPLTHARTRAEADVYKVEPYVVCADVYSAEGHVGRGGWTWYTGSASWTYRAALEALLGFNLRGDHLVLAPCIPSAWSHFEVDYRHGDAVYAIRVENPSGVCSGVASVRIDGQEMPDERIPLADDGRRHEVLVTMGPMAGAREPSVPAGRSAAEPDA